MRADARRNRERIVAAAREVFAEQGPGASLNQVAQRAGVGAGTLYRHFPTSQDLFVEIIQDQVAALCAHGRELGASVARRGPRSSAAGERLRRRGAGTIRRV